MNWFLIALKNTFNFNCRSRRREFGWFYLINMMISFVISMFIFLSERMGLFSFSQLLSIVNDIWGYAIMLTLISLVTRRLHDIGSSGWWQLLYYIPLGIVYLRSYQLTGSLSLEMLSVSFDDIIVKVASFAFLIFACIMTLIFAFVDGDKHPNKYGESPKYPSSTPQTDIQ